MKITNVCATKAFDSEIEAMEAMLACGYSESAIEDMEILAYYDQRGGVSEVIVFSRYGDYAGNNADGWNGVNSLTEIGDLNADEIDHIYGEGAAKRPIWQSYLALKDRESSAAV